ncbi:unnamed protein product [Phytophthora lilii]|uniref:Unnamed protein product n=1 Tax=Phytophthora lilii TaxID=2077276 RepID=A0A9W6UBF6_9STRA|nr:unnamed protein product [Phytophthora lilii]
MDSSLAQALSFFELLIVSALPVELYVQLLALELRLLERLEQMLAGTDEHISSIIASVLESGGKERLAGAEACSPELCQRLVTMSEEFITTINKALNRMQDISPRVCAFTATNPASLVGVKQLPQLDDILRAIARIRQQEVDYMQKVHELQKMLKDSGELASLGDEVRDVDLANGA